MAIVNMDQQFLYAWESCIYKTLCIKLSEIDLGILSSLLSLMTPVHVYAFDMIIKVSLIVYYQLLLAPFVNTNLESKNFHFLN